MLLRLILYAVIFILLVRFISRLFLPQPKKKQGTARTFYQIFKNVRDQQKQQERHSGQEDVKDRLDDIEEAEYEDVTDEKSESSA